MADLFFLAGFSRARGRTRICGFLENHKSAERHPNSTVVGISRGNSWQDPIVKDLLFLQSVTNDIRGDIIVSAIESVNASAIDSLVSMYAKVIKEDPRKAYRFI